LVKEIFKIQKTSYGFFYIPQVDFKVYGQFSLSKSYLSRPLKRQIISPKTEKRTQIGKLPAQETRQI